MRHLIKPISVRISTSLDGGVSPPYGVAQLWFSFDGENEVRDKCSMRYIIVFCFVVGGALSFGASEFDFQEFCEIDLSNPPIGGLIAADPRPAQEIFKAIDQQSLEFSRYHSGYSIQTALGFDREDQAQIGLSAPVKINPEGAKQMLDSVQGLLRYIETVKERRYISVEESDDFPRKGFAVEESIWMQSPLPKGADYVDYRNVVLSTALFPSKEFSTLAGRSKAFGSILGREIEFLRYHPNIVVHVPISVMTKNSLRLPKIDFDDEPWRNKPWRYTEKDKRDIKSQYNDWSVTSEKNLFTGKALKNLVRDLKSEIDKRVGATFWSISAKTIASAPFPGRNELVLTIEAPIIETAWRASLEFIELYGQAMRSQLKDLKPVSVESTKPLIVPPVVTSLKSTK